MGFDKSFDMEWDSMVHSSGEALVTNNGKVNVNSKKAIAAAKLIMDMVNDGTALTFSSSAGITATQAATSKDFDWGTTPLPSYQGKSATVLAGNSLVVTATASKKQQSGAWAFMKFLMSDKQTEKLVVVNPYERNIDRLLALQNTAHENGRKLLWNHRVGGILKAMGAKNVQEIDWVKVLSKLSHYVVQNQFDQLHELDKINGQFLYLHMNGEPLGEYDAHFVALSNYLSNPIYRFKVIGR